MLRSSQNTLIVTIGVFLMTLALPAIAEETCQKWTAIALNPKNWTVPYDGFGQVVIQDNVKLQPRRIASESGTHAALALWNEKIRDTNFQLRVRYHNVKALRTPQSNSWEVFWLFFNYQANAKSPDRESEGKQTNYFIFKPNGVEFGKAWGAEQQEFLATADQPQQEFGRDYELVLTRSPHSVSASINGKNVLQYEDRKSHALYAEPGQIGLYTEDSVVQINSVEICADKKTN